MGYSDSPFLYMDGVLSKCQLPVSYQRERRLVGVVIQNQKDKKMRIHSRMYILVFNGYVCM